jgi:hypothetical protein
MANEQLGTDSVVRLIERLKVESHRKIAHEWDYSMKNAATCYGRPIGFDTRRIYLNGFTKISKYLLENGSNLYQATIKAIEALDPQQYSTKKHVKEASISLCKYLIYTTEGAN